MFEPDGRHFKTAFGKDFIDHLFACAESGMIQVDLDADVRLVSEANRLTTVEGRVNLVRRDLHRSNQRVDFVVARAAEDGDAILNEK